MDQNRYTPTVCPRCGVELPAQKINLCAAVSDVVRKRQDLSYREIGKLFGVGDRTVKRYAKRAGLHRRRGVKGKWMSMLPPLE